jgi:Domain of unknown function (DUF4037)
MREHFPVGPPEESGALGCVDAFAQQLSLAVVAGVLLDHVDVHPAHLHPRVTARVARTLRSARGLPSRTGGRHCRGHGGRFGGHPLQSCRCTLSYGGSIQVGERFVSGLELSAALYTYVEQILRRRFPDLRYAAARLARGSDVLGFDDARSTDHYWGPMLELFLTQDDHARLSQQIHDVLAVELPFEINGYPTHFRPFEGVEAHFGRLGHLEARRERPINHGVSTLTVRHFFWTWLRVNPLEEIQPVEWVLMSEQNLRMVTAGRVFRDDFGELSAARARLSYYPHEVWLYLIAAGWARIGQEAPFVGRTVESGDELGSRLIAGRLVRDIMRLAFLFGRTYAPYAKWFGTAFNRLERASSLGPHLQGALAASTFSEREAHLVAAFEDIARMHNELGVTAPVPVNVSLFHERPYRVIDTEAFVRAAEEAISEPAVRAWPRRIGSVNQWADATDMLDRPSLLASLRSFYDNASIQPGDPPQRTAHYPAGHPLDA